MAIDLIERSFIVLALGLVRALIVAAILSVVFYFLLVKPLSLMSETLSKADPNRPASTHLIAPARNRGDEFYNLAESVNALLRVIGRRNLERDEAENRLKQTSLSLEATVVERTAKLQATALAAEAANVAKSNFLSTMSHEIRTPLNGVLGIAQLMTDTNLDQNQTAKMNTIISSGQTLLAIINDVLDMSKIEAGGLELENRAFNLKNLMSTITTPFQSLADDKGLALNVTDRIDSSFVAKGDPVRLRQILWNLLSNAIKFSEQGSVSLFIEELEGISDQVLDVKHHALHFSIQDTGAGIADDRIDAIFDAFTQEDTSITRKHGGTGLGLSIVKQLIDVMGGTVSVDSKLGEGTRFDVYLPFDQASTDEIETISLRKITGTNQSVEPLNILIAEDNEVNAVITRAFLEKFGHRVKHVENGKLAVEAAKEGWANFILMDVHMPEMNGVDATRMIRASETDDKVPIVGLTAEAFAERHVMFMEAGMDGVLTKPFTEQQLAETLAAYRTEDRRGSDRPDRSGSEPGKKDQNKTIQLLRTDDSDELPVATSAPPAHINPLGDQDKLDEFRQQLNSETVSALLVTAQETLQTRMDELRSGVTSSNPTQIREAVHSIKGACGSMFATRISLLAATIEEKSSNIDAVRALMPEFEETSRDTVEWWRNQSL